MEKKSIHLLRWLQKCLILFSLSVSLRIPARFASFIYELSYKMLSVSRVQPFQQKCFKEILAFVLSGVDCYTLYKMSLKMF
jgi:hypothetical protein